MPKHARTRPSEIRDTVARAEAMAITERRVGISTAVARPMCLVRSVAKARWTNESSHSGAESYIQTCLVAKVLGQHSQVGKLRSRG